jgi:Concanavalin A-like lectin/glucanases superfamily/Vacuolar protein sorting-associated protein 62
VFEAVYSANRQSTPVASMKMKRFLPVTTAVVAVLGFSISTRAPAQTGWGNAISFDGVDDSVLIPRFGAIAPTTEITIEFWQKGSAVKAQRTFGLGPDENSNRMQAHVPWLDGQVYWDFGNISSGGRLAYTPPVAITNSWQHFAFVASQSGNFMRIYRNGVLEAEKTGMTPFGRGAYDLYLGGNNQIFFEGQLDEFRIWNVARSKEQIIAHMRHRLTGAESNLVAYWPFDEGAGSITRDATRLGNTGVLMNGPAWQSGMDNPPTPYPRMQATWETPGEVLLSSDTVPGQGFQIFTNSDLQGPWWPLAGHPPFRATDDVTSLPVVPQPGVSFFRSELEPMVYAITDVIVSDNCGSVPLEYTGLGYNVATTPYIPDVVGARVAGNDVNVGIGGSTTCISANYRRLGAWMDAETPVLTDIAVVHWPGWNAVCPDGHPLNDANPQCVDGWQRAGGTSAGREGALTTGTDGACWDNGLCVRYQPLGEVMAQFKPYILKLSLSVTSGGIAYPPGEVGWSNDNLDIHASCGDSRFVYVCFKKEFVLPSPIRYGITDVMVSDNGAGVPLDYTGLGYNVATTPYIPGVVGERVAGRDVNVGIGGSTTSIWAKYGNLETATDPQMPVLTDIAVVHWPGWNAVCPDGHPLNDANPQCVDGWQRASGTSAGREGALTTGTDGACWDNGLCVRYQPLRDVLTNNLLYVEKLSLSVTGGGIVFPSDPAVWLSTTLDIHAACGDDRFVYVCYAKRSFTPPAPVTDQEKLDLLTRYAPMVWLAQNEQYMPSSLEWAFPYFERVLFPKDAFTFPPDLTQVYWLQTTNQLSSPSDSSLPVFAGNLASAPVYAFWVEKQPGARLVDLVYFFYYPYNRGKEIANTIWGNHVSDWEHVTVRLVWGQPEAVYISAHDFGGAYPWYLNALGRTNLTHPIIYSAWGSHGCWVNPGSHTYDSIPALGDLTDYCSAGTPWNTWERVAAFDYNAQAGLGASQWPAWMSTDYGNPGTGDPTIPGNGPIYRWGNPRQGTCVSGECRLNDGPTGPADKNVWAPGIFQ